MSGNQSHSASGLGQSSFAPNLQGPPAKRRKVLNTMTDLQVWEYPDDEILAAARETWRSTAYQHYNAHLERRFTPSGAPDRLVIRFECKYDPHNHSPQYRERTKTSAGTQALLSSANRCTARRGVNSGSRSRPNPQSAPREEWSGIKHRALVLMLAADSRLPPRTFGGPEFQGLTNALRPGTKGPDTARITADIEHVYSTSSPAVARHLQRIPQAIHLVIDGWTNLSGMSRIAVAVCWHEEAKVWRAILDVCAVGQYDPDDYLADLTLEYLNKYGIAGKIMSACLDHAPQSEKLIAQLAERIPTFRGPKSRVLSLSHVVGLMSRSFMSFFYPATPAVRVKEADSIKTDPEDNDPSELPTPLELRRTPYNNMIIQSVAAEAQTKMASSGISIPESTLASARGLMTKIAGLADSSDYPRELREHFEELVKQHAPDLRGDDESGLVQRVPELWNTDRAALDFHLRFKKIVQKLTAADLEVTRYLGEFALSDDQWALATELSSVLEVFQELTDRFSKRDILLIHQVVPELWSLQARLKDVRDDYFNVGLSPVTRTAAQAALLAFEKLIGADEQSDIYDIAVVMCPDRKLQWPSGRGFDIERMKARVVARFNESYANIESRNLPRSGILDPHPGSTPGSVWTQRHSSSSSDTEMDTIEAYLQNPLVTEHVITQRGGLLAYWNSQLATQPRVARMALDYLSVPASSVDTELVFDGGPLFTSGLRDEVEASTFRAQVALGSWFNTPLIPDVDDVTRMLENIVAL